MHLPAMSLTCKAGDGGGWGRWVLSSALRYVTPLRYAVTRYDVGMPFAKIDTEILTSSLWVDRDLRDIFLTALLMARPFDITEPTPQLKIDTLEETGFVVPPGRYGFIHSADSGIISRALVGMEQGQRALVALGEPDRKSRSREFEGRRMVRINDGFLILNFMRYRNFDSTNAERQRRYRRRQQESGAPPARSSRRQNRIY